jgi:hypothetical protein
MHSSHPKREISTKEWVKLELLWNGCLEISRTKFFSFVDFKRHTKLNLRAVGKMYYICALLENARTCLYGNIVSSFFELSPPTLDEYFW